MKKKKILMIRGKNLNPWDMQMYEPLQDEFDIQAVEHPRNRFDTSLISFPIIKLNDIRNFIGDPLSILSKNKQKYFYKYQLSKLLHDVDIVHSVEPFTNYTNTVCLLKNRFKYKIVITVWENIPFKSIINPSDFEKRNFCYPCIDKIIVPTISTKNALMLEGIDKEKIVHIYPGFNLEKFQPNRSNYHEVSIPGISGDDFVILFIGRLVYQKGVFDILASAKLLLNDPELANYKLKFLIIGKGKEETNIEKLIKEYKIRDSLIVKKDVSYNDIPNYYNAAKIFICPSIPEKNWQEQFGMVFVESMASGVVPVGSFCGAIPEVIGNAGMLAQPGNYIDLAEKIKKLILNESFRNQLRQSGILISKEKFDHRTQAKNIAEVYNSLINRLN